MKKIFIIFMGIILLIPSIVHGEEKLATNAKSAILMEVSTGKILFEKDKNSRYAVASLTKIMSQLLIIEKIESGGLSWDKKVTTSSNAAGYGGSQIYLEAGEVMTVRDLMKGVSMASANDAVVALAEEVAGSEEKFVEMMNNKAKELGLKNTNFTNSTGLDEENNYSSAYDLSIIAKELMKHDVIFEFSSLYEDYLRQDTNNKFWLVNTNKLVRLYDGADGLKTGFTDNAGYTMAVTAKRNNLRLLAIVLGEAVSKVRNSEVVEMLDYGFNTYKINLLRKKNEFVDKIKIKKGNKDSINILVDRDMTVLNLKSDSDKEYKEKLVLNDIKLPIKKGDRVGYIELYDMEKMIGKYDLVSDSDVSKKSFINVFIEGIAKILSGNYDC